MSETNPMLEKVARALFAKRNEAAAGYKQLPQYTWEDENQPYREFVLSEARAVIEAIREPTEAMVERGAAIEGRSAAVATWLAMIGAILTPTQDGDEAKP